MKAMVTIVATVATIFLVTGALQAEIVSWTGASGVAPWDASVPADQRFTLFGDSSFATMQVGHFNIADTVTASAVNVLKDDLPLISADAQFAFQVRLRVNAHARSILDWGAYSGMRGGGWLVGIIVSHDGVGFSGDSANSYVDGLFSSLDTTDEFHNYLVVRTVNSVALYIDGSSVAAISAPLTHFQPTTENVFRLATSSNRGTSDFDIESFAYNLQGTTVPEPATMSLLALGLGALASRRRRRGR